MVMQMSPVFLFSLSVLSSLTIWTTELHIGSVWIPAEFMQFAVLHKKSSRNVNTKKKKKKLYVSFLSWCSLLF